jgi:hypothetical protein
LVAFFGLVDAQIGAGECLILAKSKRQGNLLRPAPDGDATFRRALP